MMLARFTLIDYDREMALVAIFKERKAGPDGEIVETERIVGVSRYITNPDHSSCEFALVVADDFSGKAGQQPRDAQTHAQSGVLDQGLCG